MSRIARVTQKIFAGSAANNGVFGSAALGTPTTSSVISTIMAGAAWAAGWVSATLGSSKFPALEEFQGVEYVHSTQIAYLLQQGLPEYDSGTTYYIDNICVKPLTFELYGSLVDNNIGNPLPSAVSNANWQYLGNLANLAAAAPPFTDTNAIIKGSADATKLMRFEVDGFTTGTTRVCTPPNKDGTMAYTNDNLSVFAATTSAQLAGVISDETGSGALVFATSPALAGTPTAPTAANGTNTTQVATTAFAYGTLVTGTNGYLILPNGMIIQWGAIGSSSGATTSLPIAYPNANYGVWMQGNSDWLDVKVTALGLSNFTWSANGGSQTNTFFSIGR